MPEILASTVVLSCRIEVNKIAEVLSNKSILWSDTRNLLN